MEEHSTGVPRVITGEIRRADKLKKSSKGTVVYGSVIAARRVQFY